MSKDGFGVTPVERGIIRGSTEPAPRVITDAHVCWDADYPCDCGGRIVVCASRTRRVTGVPCSECDRTYTVERRASP